MITFHPTSGADLSLKNPMWGDSQETHLNVALKRFADGSKRTYLRGGTYIVLHFEWKSLTKAQALALVSFIEDHWGEVLTMYHFDGSVWSGKIVTDPSTIVNQDDTCITAIKLDFEGTMTTGPNPEVSSEES